MTQARVVSSISEGMKRNILAKGVPESHYFMLPNWADLSFIRPLPVNTSLRTELGIRPDDFVVLYSGNLGDKQGVELILDAAALLTNHANIRFIICGEGVGRKTLEALSANYGLTSVLFLPLQPYALLPQLLASADIHLIVQKRAASDVVMPSKLTTILGAGGASVVTADLGSSLASIILDNRLGWITPPEDATALASLIVRCVGNSLLKQFRLNARAYAEAYLSKDAILTRLETMLTNLPLNK